MTIFTVGLGKEFTTINDAYYVTSDGDTILIDEGIYYENIYMENKVVNLIGITDYPAEGKVEIVGDEVRGTFRTKWGSTTEINILIEGIKFRSSTTTSYNLIYFYYTTSIQSGLGITFNKCVFNTENFTDDHYIFQNNYTVAGPSSGLNSLTLKHCDCYMHGNYFANSSIYRIPIRIMEKCKLNEIPYEIYVDDGPNITPFDNPYYNYILMSNTYSGYGAVFGNFITDLPKKAYFTGEIKENSVHVSRELRFFRCDNDVYLGSTVSSGVNGYYNFESTFSGHHYILCLDDVASPYFNDLIKAKCTPSGLPQITYIREPLTVVNPGAETGDLTGWVVEAGTFDTTTTRYSGAYAFHDTGSTDPAVMSQRVDLISEGVSTTTIDNEMYFVETKVMVRTGYADKGWIGTRCLDSTQSIIGVDYFGPYLDAYTSWRSEYIRTPVVSGTRYIDVILKTDEIGGGYTDIQFDDIVLNLVRSL